MVHTWADPAPPLEGGGWGVGQRAGGQLPEWPKGKRWQVQSLKTRGGDGAPRTFFPCTLLPLSLFPPSGRGTGGSGGRDCAGGCDWAPAYQNLRSCGNHSSWVLHRVVGVLHRVLGVLYRVVGVLQRVVGVLHRVVGVTPFRVRRMWLVCDACNVMAHGAPLSLSSSGSRGDCVPQEPPLVLWGPPPGC